MPLSAERRQRLEATLPPASVTRERLRAYMETIDVRPAVLCKHLGYSYQAIRSFMVDAYVANGISQSDLLIREAAEDYMARHPLHTPGECRNRGRFHETENSLQMRELFTHCHKNGGMAVLYGPPGSQKTYVAEALVAEFNRRELAIEDSANRAYLIRCSVNITPRDLFARICRELGIPSSSRKEVCLNVIALAAREKRVLLVLDEAQLLDLRALEAIRELNDMQSVGLLLMGSHKLREFFEQHAANLEQFNSRIDDLVELKGVSERSARAILQIELPALTPASIDGAIEDARVADIYSRIAGKTYISMRRLFKTIAAFRDATNDATNAPQEVVQ